jgi:Fic family protein
MTKNSRTKPKGATSYKETSFGIIPKSRLLELEIEGTDKGLKFINQLIVENSDPPVTPNLILTLHQVSFGWIFPDWAGKYRKIQVTISGKECPLYTKISELITNLCKDLEEQLRHLHNHEDDEFISEVIRLLAWFQHQFVYIHPFQDYNGRTARMLTTLLLLKLKLPPAEIKIKTSKDRQGYLGAMQDADNGNLSLLESIISQAVTESLEDILQILDTENKR